MKCLKQIIAVYYVNRNEHVNTLREKKYRQCTYNVIPKSVRDSLLPWKSYKYFLLVRVGVRERACVHVGTRERWSVHSLRAYSLANPACKAYAQCCDVICGPSVTIRFFDIIS